MEFPCSIVKHKLSSKSKLFSIQWKTKRTSSSNGLCFCHQQHIKWQTIYAVPKYAVLALVDGFWSRDCLNNLIWFPTTPTLQTHFYYYYGPIDITCIYKLTEYVRIYNGCFFFFFCRIEKKNVDIYTSIRWWSQTVWKTTTTTTEHF